MVNHIRVGRLLLAGMAVVAVVLLVSGAGSLGEKRGADAQTLQRPNIVFVMTDDLDERSMQHLGGVRTVMGSNGVAFDKAYVTYSLCCPSRASFLRGQYPHNHGIVGNLPPLGGETGFRELGRDESTVGTWLDDAGYRTSYIGKYLNNYNDLYVPPGWDEWFALRGNPNNNEINDDGRSVQLAGHSTDAFADEASDFIRRSSANPEPFFVVVGTKAPHRPPEVANRYQNSFVDIPLPRPPNFDEADTSDKARWLRAYPRLTQGQVAEIRDLYRQRLRSMLSVEDLLRQTVATLQEKGELQNTYIFFTSDNGFHLGNHRLPIGKRTSYEEDIGVPLMVRGPGVPAGAVRQQLVINNDFAPTIADLANVPTPAFVDGRSFAPLLTGSPPPSWRKAFLEEGQLETIATDTPTPTHKSAHTQDHVLIEYDTTAEHELYDLALDPFQLQSITRAEDKPLYSALETRLYNLRDCSGDACRRAESTSDTTPPRVTRTVPVAEAADVDPSSELIVILSEEMVATSIDATTFELFESGSGTKVAASVSYSASTDQAVLDPAEPLQRGAIYEARVSTEARDLAGNRLDQNSLRGLQQKAWSFTVSN